MWEEGCMKQNTYKKENKVFNLIAPIYGLFYHRQKKHYNKILDNLNKEHDITIYKTVIDIGCGTGALCSVLNQENFDVTGVDTAQKMLNIAMNKDENRSIKFLNVSATERLPFQDKSFDISFASFVVHGLKEEDRMRVYAEMNRITKHQVIIYDYNDKKALVTNILEWLEKGDYFNFIKVVKLEMANNFSEFDIISSNSQFSWYLCIPK